MSRLRLTRMVIGRAQDGGTFVGDACPVCRDAGRSGAIGVYTIRREHGKIIRYLSCRQCGWKPDDNKWVEDDPSYVGDARGQKRLPFD